MPKVTEHSSDKASAVSRNRLRRWFLGVAGVVLLVVAGFAIYAFAYQSRIVPRTSVGGVAVGGLTLSQAQAALVSHETQFSQKSIELSYQAKNWQIQPSDLGLSFQNEAALAQAYSYGRGGSLVQQLGMLITAPFTSRSSSLAVSSLTKAGADYLKDHVQQDIEQPFAETSLNLTPGHVTVTEGTVGEKLNADRLMADLADAFANGASAVTLTMTSTSPELDAAQAEQARSEADAMLASAWTIQAGNQNVTLNARDIVPWLSTQVRRDANGQATSLDLVLDSGKLSAYVTSLEDKVQQTPVDATLTVTNGAVAIAQDGKDGVKLDDVQTAAALKSALLAADPGKRTVAAIAQVVHPDVWSATLPTLGLTQLIGTGTTDFAGSPSNRVTNIKVGEQKISGRIVKDGEEFSTVSALSPIDQAHGYVQGLVIVSGKTLPADGGGLCQVSTTLFRSVLNAGLPVTARTSHSYEVSYYQRGIGPGLDATIYDPNPDFKWKNDTGHVIYIQATLKGSALTFDLYGTSDGRTAAIDGPHTLQTYEPSGDPIYVNTDTLAKGTTVQIDPPVQGARTTATYTVSRDGKVINTQTFNSFYQAMPAQYLVGTKE